jgi:hypothetical protein
MRIAVLSDTHLSSPDTRLDSIYTDFLEISDLVVHCGDMTGSDVYCFLARHPGFYAVRGNCDHYPEARDVPATATMEVQGLRIGAAHGWGPRQSVGGTVARSFGPGYDLILYGHTHMRDWRRLACGVRILNPGSTHEPRHGEKPGFAWLEISSNGRMEVEWVDL